MWKTSRVMQFKAMPSSTDKHTAAALAIIPVIYLWLRTNFKLLSHTHISGVSFSLFHKANITSNRRLQSIQFHYGCPPWSNHFKRIRTISQIKDDTVEFLAKQHKKWTQKFSSGRNGINFSDNWCTITRNVEQRKGCTFHETFTDQKKKKKCTPSA